MMKYILLGMIRTYQLLPGPWHNYCRHIPTCSEYAIDAIIEYGSIKGAKLAVIRILKCNPFGTYGYDPVIKRSEKK